jgi:prepilin signal peptidase PulO-like enzyme (type II secretory pathway)
VFGVLLNFLSFLFGLAVGSFLNCIIYRLEKNKTFVRGRSFCPHCKHVLVWQDLVPLLSFVVLKGRCRYCQKKISWQYPLVELATGILFVLIVNQSLVNGHLGALNLRVLLTIFFQIIISSLLVVVFIYDLKHYIIPDEVIYSAITLSFFYRIIEKSFSLNVLLSTLSATIFFLSIFLISQGKWLGFGDVKLAFLMGLYLGFPNILVALFSAFLTGGLIGVTLIATKKKTLKSEVPFGPFLVTGTFMAMFWGEQLINWYWNLFL